MNRRELLLALFVSPLCWLLGVKRSIWRYGPYRHTADELRIKRQFEITVQKVKEMEKMFGPQLFLRADLREAVASKGGGA